MTDRYHGLDLLRGGAMLLGPVVHALVIYDRPDVYVAITDRPAESLTMPGLWVPILAGWIHMWRMPLFFALAGFFAAMGLARHGPVAWARDRAWRVLAPFALFLGLHDLLAAGPPGQLMHLWFLYYLVGFCALAALAAWAVPPRWLDRAAWPLAGRWRPWLFLPLLVALTALAREGGVETCIPEQLGEVRPATFAYFLLWFAIGAGLWARRGDLAALARPAVTAVAIAGATLAHVALLATWADGTPPDTGYADLFGALSTTLWSLGLTGLALRVARRPAAWRRWLAEIAYPVYLLHLLPTLAAASWLAAAGYPAWLVLLGSSAMGFFGSVALTLIAIRPTPLDRLLRRPRPTTA